MIDLQLLIEQANDLAPFPASTVRLAQLVTTPDGNLGEGADLGLLTIHRSRSSYCEPRTVPLSQFNHHE